MSFFASDEFRLLWAALLNAAVLAGAWRLARRFDGGRLDAAGDAGLLYYLVQYLSVCVPGILGALHPLTMTLVALLLSAGMALAGGRWRGARARARDRKRPGDDEAIDQTTLSRAAALAGVGFVIGYAIALVWHQRRLPVISNDAITYHLPAAVQWLMSGSLGLYPAWFYNPANSYSPLAGSAFIAWLLAPVGNDAIARFVQIGPMLLLLIGMLNLCRRLGASLGLAGLLAATLVLARPFISQTILTKDDLFVAAFFVLTIDVMSRRRFAQRIGPWRLGIALGLLLATKYTVLLSLPILLLMLGRGWNWRRCAIVLGCALVLAGPWYLRNWILVGNPLYPTAVRFAGVTIFRGMLDVHRSALLWTPRGAWDVFTGGYYALPVVLALILIAGWIAGVLVAFRQRQWGRPVVRTCLLGPVIGIGLFVALAPYGEMRFAYPSLALLIGAMAIALKAFPPVAQITGAAALVVLAGGTAFLPQLTAGFLAAGAAGACIGLIALASWRAKLARMILLAGAATAGVMGGLTTMYDYLRLPGDQRLYSWQAEYGPVADVWGFVRQQLPPGAVLAYANTYFTYPLMGFAYDHPVVYAPTRHDLNRFTDMPPIGQPITGEQIVTYICAELRENPDQAQWLRRLRDSGAAYLVVMKQDPARPSVTVAPPELVFTAINASRFAPVFDNEAGTVFRINW